MLHQPGLTVILGALALAHAPGGQELAVTNYKVSDIYFRYSLGKILLSTLHAMRILSSPGNLLRLLHMYIRPSSHIDTCMYVLEGASPATSHYT